jgi:foldase protein PrsA
VGLVACGGGVPGNGVAKVGDNVITTAAFKHWMGVAAVANTGGVPGAKPVVPEPPKYTACVARQRELTPKTAKGQAPPSEATLRSQCATQYKSLLTEVLGFLISSEWVIGEAKSLGVKLTDAEVHKQFLKIKNQQFPKSSEFEKFLASSGQTVSDLLLRVKLNMLSQKIQQKIIKGKATVTPAQAEQYFKNNKSRYGTPEKRNVEVILTKTEAAAKSAKKEVESGKSFASVAKRVSTDSASRANGGKLTEVVKGEEAKALDEAIFREAKNVLAGPVKTPFGFYILRVTAITPGTQQSFSQVKDSIKTQLAATHQQEALSKFVKNFRKKWTGKTDCRAGYVVADCKQYKPPKGGTATTPGR